MACQWIKNSRDAVWLWQFLSKTSDFDTKKLRRLLLQALVRKIGSHPTLDQRRDIALKHSRLQDKVGTFKNQARSMLHAVSNDGDDSWGDDYTREMYTGAEFDGVGKEDNNGAAEGQYQMQVPSSSPPGPHKCRAYLTAFSLSY